MKFKKQARQGDCLLIKIKSIPKDAELAKAENGKLIVAHSESGHHHVVLERSAQLLIDKTNKFISYLNVKEPCSLDHLREYHTHKSIPLDKGMYQVRHRREYTPEGFRKVQD